MHATDLRRKQRIFGRQGTFTMTLSPYTEATIELVDFACEPGPGIKHWNLLFTQQPDVS